MPSMYQSQCPIERRVCVSSNCRPNGVSIISIIHLEVFEIRQGSRHHTYCYSSLFILVSQTELAITLGEYIYFMHSTLFN